METLSLVLNGFVVNEHDEIIGAVTGLEIKHGRMLIQVLEGVMAEPSDPGDGEEAEDPDEVQKFDTAEIMRRGETARLKPQLVENG